MSPKTIGMVSGLLVIASVIPYSIRVWQNKIHPNPTSWSLWTLIGLSLLLTYKSSGATDSVWPSVFGFTNPLLITLILTTRRERWRRFDRVEKACLALGLISLGAWLLVHDNDDLTQYALYLAIVADGCAVLPTIKFVWNEPEKERPLAWCCFGTGYGLAVFAITDHTFSNYVLPIYMFCGAWCVAIPLIVYRLRSKSPLSEWI
ncbi:MAG: hypothetical protein WD200_00190 [Candidatus Andersenbacteria bacterium]